MGFDYQALLLGMPAVLFSLVFHEFGHAAAAARLGHMVRDADERLTLDPRGHLDPLGSLLLPALGLALGGFLFGWAKPVQWVASPGGNRRRDGLIVAAAGPAMNLVLMVVFTVLLKTLATAGVGSVGALVGRMAYFGLFFNAVLIVFNLIPLPPLDGHTVLQGLLDPVRARRLQLINPGMALLFILLLAFSGALSYPINGLMNVALTLGGLK